MLLIISIEWDLVDFVVAWRFLDFGEWAVVDIVGSIEILWFWLSFVKELLCKSDFESETLRRLNKVIKLTSKKKIEYQIWIVIWNRIIYQIMCTNRNNYSYSNPIQFNNHCKHYNIINLMLIYDIDLWYFNQPLIQSLCDELKESLSNIIWKENLIINY